METVSKSYTILSENLTDLVKVIAKLNRKAAKLGLQAITLTEGERSTKLDAEGVGVYQYVEVTVTGTAPRVNGFEFVATVQHGQDDNGQSINVLRTVPTFEYVLPEVFRTTDPSRCDHCQTNRRRIDTYIVYNDQPGYHEQYEGRFAQVGRNCLADFLGGSDPHRYASMAEWLMLACEAAEGAGGYFGTRQPTMLAKGKALAYAAESVIRNGWVSRTKARNGDGYATADDALDNMFPPPASGFKAWTPSEAAVTLAETVLEWADEWIPAQLERPQSSDYIWNLKVSLTGEQINVRSFGIAASVLGAYARETERAAEHKAKNANLGGSEYQGKVGDKFKDRPLTIESFRVIEGQWGTSTLIQFTDASHNLYKWFSSNFWEPTVGETVLVSGTIKAHEEYKGVKATMMTRCKVK